MRIFPFVLILLIQFLIPNILTAQKGDKKRLQDQYQLHISPAPDEINIDGLLDEPVWEKAARADNFWMIFPVDDRRVDSSLQTIVRVTYDDQYIYFGVICKGKDNYVIQTLKRDTDFWRGDAFALVLDPVNQQTNGFTFGVNPAGVQTESLVSGQVGSRNSSSGSSSQSGRPSSSTSGINTAWDNKWFSEVRTYPDHWVAEIAIPYKSLRFEADKKIWGVNFIRGDVRTNSFHTWSPVPVQFRGVDLGYTGALIWDVPPKKTSRNVSVIPYGLTSVSRDYEENQPREENFRIGGDAKLAITPSLNLDITVNPDFSQVDVDQQVTNLTRVNVRFPERRLFFLENSDIFEDFGIPPMRNFFSRRIGLDEEGESIPINFGGRLSGNINKDLRIGIMNMQTGKTAEFQSQNYTAVAVHQQVLARSVIKGFFHNRQATEGLKNQPGDYTRNAGLGFQYLSRDGKVRVAAGYALSFKKEITSKNQFYNGEINYSGRNLNFYTNIASAGDYYYADLGFIPKQFHYDAVADTSYQIGFTHNFERLSYNIYPENNPRVLFHRFEIRNSWDFTHEQVMFNRDSRGTYQIRFNNSSQIEATYYNAFTRLLFPFTFTDDYEPLPKGRYDYSYGEINYMSDSRRLLSFNAGVQYGGFYNGSRIQYSLGFNYRAQPWGNFGANIVRNDLQFPDPYGSTTLLLLSPTIEINFSRALFWTTFLQYNTQKDNFNINSRLQWRFKPMSDLFIVYSDNYAVEFWGPKNRTLVVKLNYWFNL